MIPRVNGGDALLRAGLIDALQFQSALAYRERWGGSLEHAIVELGFASQSVLMTALARHLGVPYVEIRERSISPDVLQLVPEKLIRARRILPVALSCETRLGPLFVATTDPGNLPILDEVAFTTGKRVAPVLATEDDIDHAIARYFGQARRAG